MRLLGPFYLVRFLVGLSLFFPAYYVVFFRELNFSFSQIGFLFLVFGFSSLFFEVPTGVVADSFSRKTSSLIGLLIISLSGFGMFFFTSYVLQIFSWAFFAFGQTFISGAFESWVVSNLAFKRKKSALLHSFFMKNDILFASGILIASLLSSLFVPLFGIKVIFVALIIGSFLAFLISVFISEHYVPSKNRSEKYSFSHSFKILKRGWSFVLSNKIIFLLFLGSFFGVFMHIGFDAWQPFLLNLGMPESGLGIQMAIISIGAILAPMASSFFKKFPIKNVLLFSVLFEMFFLALVFFINPPMFLFAAFVYFFIMNIPGASSPLVEGLKHNVLSESFRSTVLSLESMSNGVAIGLASLFGGFLIDAVGINLAISLGALFGIGALISYSKLKIPKKFQVK